MKKTNFLLLIAAGICYFIITGYDNGPGTNGWDFTGAETGLGNPAGCTNCHGATATSGINISMELDSAGIPTTKYKGGMSYTVKLTGINNTSFSLPKFGFQIGSIEGSSALQTPVNAGTWTTPLPANTHIANPQSGNFVVRLVEHTIPLSTTTGTGGNGSTYEITFDWTAPDSGTGTVSIWAALNLINGNGNTSGDKWNTNHIVIDEWQTGSTGISSLEKNLLEVNIFPNPFSEYAVVRITNDYEFANEKLELKIYNVLGREVKNFNPQTLNFKLGRNDLPNGIYFYQVILSPSLLERAGVRRVAGGKLLIE